MPAVNLLRRDANLFLGSKPRDFFHRYMDAPRILGVMILPFHEPRTIDAARLRSCKAAFAYEDVDTGQIKTLPASDCRARFAHHRPWCPRTPSAHFRSTHRCQAVDTKG